MRLAIIAVLFGLVGLSGWYIDNIWLLFLGGCLLSCLFTFIYTIELIFDIAVKRKPQDGEIDEIIELLLKRCIRF